MPSEIDRRTRVAGATDVAFRPPSAEAKKETRTMVWPREIMWRRVMDEMSFELARIGTGPLGPEVSGTVLVAEAGAPLRIEYRISCDASWRTRAVELTQTHRGTRRTLRLDHDGAGGWRLDGRDAPALVGCTDVDLGLSPSTNALPINRLALPEGGVAPIRAAWVRFPGLDVVPAEQTYERLAERRYRYRNSASGFQATLEVDADGLPVDYSGVWRRVAEGAVAPAAPRQGFADALLSPGPAPELGDAAADLGWLVGGWEAQVRDFEADGRVLEGTGEWWFAWVLEGRAMQDVWISPKRVERAKARGPLAAKDRYGTTVRRFDRSSGLWHITWINPVSGATDHLVGHRDGERMVLLGEANGSAIRWSFNDIAADSFVWRGESRRMDGSWRTELEFRLSRVP